jgi:valyl-tRNA synthetase
LRFSLPQADWDAGAERLGPWPAEAISERFDGIMTDSALTELPSRYDPQASEGEIYRKWEAGGWFQADPQADGEPFTIVIPPPNVTGYLHIGHALNNTLQDILTRWHRMRGDNTLWVPGTDHAGIATQHVVERELRKTENVDRRDLGREKFLERVWAWKEQYGSRIISQLKRLGASCDWSRERFTMDTGLSRAVLTVFKQLFEEGLIYRGNYLVNWSPKLQTALSDDEVVYKDVASHLWHLKYPLEDGSGFIQVATTRPETMLGDTAVAVNPEDVRYTALIGKNVRLPIVNRLIPIIADDHVEKEFGTGAVKVTPAHDPNDYEMALRHGLPMINLLNPDATMNENAGAYAGLSNTEARKHVVAEFERLGLLVKIEDYTHSVGHCYRSGCVIEPYLSKQWFVKLTDERLRQPAIDAVKDGRIKFVPENYANTYFHWMGNVRDWCISRQLWWGHRIPVFECGACKHTWCEVEQTPTQCPQCGAAQVTQDPDVLDTWFSSALWPFSTLGWPDKTPELAKYYPTSTLVTAHDIIFFWVARMIVMGLHFMGEVPFRDIVINPIVRDEHGKKMSKSSGTAIDPINVIEEIGADSVRLALASYSAQSRHISLSEKRFESFRNFNNKLWNASRFVLMNTQDLTATEFGTLAADLSQGACELEDRWILGALNRAIGRANAALAKYEFDQYLDALYKFIWNEYCDWYVEFVKDRLSGKGPDERATADSRRTAQRVLIFVLDHILKLLHPVAPYVTEQIWGYLKERWGADETFGAPMLIAADWPAALEQFDLTPQTDAEMVLIQETIGRIRNIRGEMGVPPSTKVNIDVTSANEVRLAMLRDGEHYLRGMMAVGELHFGSVPALSGFASTSVIEDVTIHVYVPEELRTAERERLQKEIARLEKGIGGAQGKLANEKFVSSAPEAVVAAERERLVRMQTEVAELQVRLATLV